MDRPTTDNDIFETGTGFAELGLRKEVLQGIEKRGFVHPTIPQARIIPEALGERDILAQSKTGTGKTAAFGLPILHAFATRRPFGALILEPTRELAIQVAHELRELGRYTDLHTVPIYGGQRIPVQADKLQKNPDIIVGTPGRVMDMHRRGLLPYDKTVIAVLDEVDRMLDIGFRDDIRRILGTMRQAHQTIFVSATISDEIEGLSRKYMNDPVRLVLSESRSLTVSQVKQEHLPVQPWDKKRLLHHLLTHEEPALTLIFCRMKRTVDGLARYLGRKGIDAVEMHADLSQGQRNQVMRKLKDGHLSVVVCSDLAARGIDVDDITHVINYDLPEDPEVYVHRIGRTARTGKDGIAWSFVTPSEGALLTAIELLTNVEIARKTFDDFEPGPLPEQVQQDRTIEESRAAERKVRTSRVLSSPPQNHLAKDTTRFPGGIVPVAMPGKRMGGRLRTRRSLEREPTQDAGDPPAS